MRVYLFQCLTNVPVVIAEKKVDIFLFKPAKGLKR